jgi:hypothetical protein
MLTLTEPAVFTRPRPEADFVSVWYREGEKQIQHSQNVHGALTKRRLGPSWLSLER